MVFYSYAQTNETMRQDNHSLERTVEARGFDSDVV